MHADIGKALCVYSGFDDEKGLSLIDRVIVNWDVRAEMKHLQAHAYELNEIREEDHICIIFMVFVNFVSAFFFTCERNEYPCSTYTGQINISNWIKLNLIIIIIIIICIYPPKCASILLMG